MKRSSNSRNFFDLVDVDRVNSLIESDAINFDMYVKIRELSQIGDGLRRIIALPESDKKAWVRNNEGYLSEMMESVLHDTFGTIDGMQLDSEGLELSLQLVTVMRETMDVMQNIMRHSRTI
jgi:hypothetical protein